MNTKSTGYRDELGTPIYEGDTVLILDNNEMERSYLGVVLFKPDLGGWVVQLTACESMIRGAGWVSMAGYAVKQWRTLSQFKRPLRKSLKNVRLSVRNSDALCSLVHLQYSLPYLYR